MPAGPATPTGREPSAPHHHSHHSHHHQRSTQQQQAPYQPPPDAEPWQDFRCSEPVRACAGNVSFLFVTLVLVGDLVTDVWVTVLLALRGDMLLAGVSILVLVCSSLVGAFMYAIQTHRDTSGMLMAGGSGSGHGGSGGDGDDERPFYYIPGCLLLNVPLQLGIIGHRLRHSGRRARHCCTPPDHRPRLEWTFAKLKLAQSILQSAPMAIINMYAMLLHWNSHGVSLVQYYSAGLSFISLVAGAVHHEKVRKERVRNVYVGVVQIMCISIYKTLMLGARLLALVNFLYFYHELLAAIVVPHLVVVFLFFAYVYRAVWKVRYYKIFMHAVYCVLAYFPIHNDYRPEGEILMYYTLFIIENIIMVSVPYALKTTQRRPHVHLPGSEYYYVITVGVLVGSAVGLCFMAVYYFLLHRSKAKIQEQHLNWLSRFCIWSNKGEEAPARPMTTQSSSPDGNRLLVSQEEAANLRSTLDENIEHEHLLTVITEMDESGPPPSYSSSMTCHHDESHCGMQDDEDEEEEDDAQRPVFSTEKQESSPCCSEGREYNNARMATVRPSVLSGDEDMRDYESDQDQDTRPLHVIV